MATIAKRTDSFKKHKPLKGLIGDVTVTEAVSKGAVEAAQLLEAKLIISWTKSGRAFRMIRKYNPDAPILALTDNEQTARQLLMTRGVFSYVAKGLDKTDEFFSKAMEIAATQTKNKKGDLEVARQLGVKLPKWESQYERLYTDTKDCLKKLSRIYKIGVIANQSLGTSERLENLGVRKYLDLIIASAEEGVSKPDRRIFEIALERSSCKPENAVMIGDRIDNDIVPAKQLGMKTIWVKQGFGSLWNITDESEKADMEINNLSDVLKYL